MKKIHFIKQHDSMECGIACLQMICSYYGKEFKQEFLSNLCHATNEGVSLLAIKDVASRIGLYSISGRITINKLFSCE